MIKMTFTKTTQARSDALLFIHQSLPTHQWQYNEVEIHALKNAMLNHSLFQHPILKQMLEQHLTLEHLQKIHIHYFHAIVHIFTDALSMLIFQTQQLDHAINLKAESRHIAKIYARYLLSLNLIDELGFNSAKLEKSSPNKSHLVYFTQLIEQLDISSDSTPCAEAQHIRDFIKNHYNEYSHLLLILACTEKQVIYFSQALSQNLYKYDPKYCQGYYECHGEADHSDRLANDDNHEDDLWCLLTQCYVKQNEQTLTILEQEYLTLWANFWSKMQSMQD